MTGSEGDAGVDAMTYAGQLIVQDQINTSNDIYAKDTVNPFIQISLD